MLDRQNHKLYKLRWYQFSLRTLLIVVSVAGAGLGWLGMIVHRVQSQRSAVKRINSLGGRSFLDYEAGPTKAGSPPGPALIRRMMGDDVFSYVTMVQLNSAQGTLKDEDLAILGQLPRIRHLILSSSGITDKGLSVISDLPLLEELEIDNLQISGEGLVQLRKNSKLEILTIAGRSVDDRTVKNISALTNIRQLNFRETNITDESLGNLPNFPRLNGVGIVKNSRLTRTCLDFIGQCKHIKFVSIFGNTSIDGGFGQLKDLKELEVFGVTCCPFNDDDMKVLEGCNELTEVYLTGTNITDDGMVHLQNLSKLQQIALDYTNIGDEGAKYLRDLKHIRLLRIDSTKITIHGLSQFKDFANLTDLSVGSNISKGDLEVFHKSIPGCRISIIDPIGGLERLEPLHPAGGPP